MGGVTVAPEGAAGRDDPNRRLARHQGANLHRGRMRAQDLAFAPVDGPEIERVDVLAGRMLGRDVERGEVVEVVLDVRALGNPETELAQNRRHFIERPRDRMAAAGRLPARRQRDVGPLGGKPGFQGRVLQGGLAFAQRAGQALLDRVQMLAGGAPLVSRQAGHRAEHAVELALAAERPDADGFKLVRVRGGLHRSEQRLFKSVCLRKERAHRASPEPGPVAAGSWVSEPRGRLAPV